MSGTTLKKRTFTADEKTAWREQKRADADNILGEIVTMFESGELPELVAQTVIARVEGLPISRWSLCNQLLAVRAGTTDARGFRQWQEVGRNVKKGTHAFRILGPVLAKREETDADGSKVERKRVVGFRPIPVFRIQDTEGDELASSYAPAELPPLFEVAGKLGVSVEWMPENQLASFRGYYAPGRDEIALLTHDVRTFFHELAHAAHDRVLRAEGRRTVTSIPEAEAEVVAETTAATLCRLYGYDGYLFHGAQYIEHFAHENPGRAAAHVLGIVQKVLGLIIEQADPDDAESEA